MPVTEEQHGAAPAATGAPEAPPPAVDSSDWTD
jgi:hypothetical protein